MAPIYLFKICTSGMDGAGTEQVEVAVRIAYQRYHSYICRNLVTLFAFNALAIYWCVFARRPMFSVIPNLWISGCHRTSSPKARPAFMMAAHLSG
jgi:hypothetical protein